MRLLYYKKKAQDGSDTTIFINLDSVDSFTIHPKGDVTELYFIIGNDVHVYNEKKVVSATVLVRRLLDVTDRSYLSLDEFIDSCNTVAKQKK
jgi:hypothetical protein